MSTAVPLRGFGGGTSLQFKIITVSSASDLPISAKENTIAAIPVVPYEGRYEFATTSPVAEAGKIWVQIATSSPFSFSLTKKNQIQVYPIRCYQYDSGWVAVETFIYQRGVWHQFGTANLFKAGNECTSFTGGWTGKMLPYSGVAGISLSVKNDGTRLYTGLNSDYLGSDANIGAVMCCRNKIDLTHYKTLTFEQSFNRHGSTSLAWYACWTDWGDTFQQNLAVVKKLTASSSNDVVLDISALEGEHYVGVGLRASNLTLFNCYMTM